MFYAAFLEAGREAFVFELETNLSGSCFFILFFEDAFFFMGLGFEFETDFEIGGGAKASEASRSSFFVSGVLSHSGNCLGSIFLEWEWG
jgi:hypothetical protein